MTIVDLASAEVQERAAAMLVEAFRNQSPNAWPDFPAAREEVQEALEPGRIGRVALDDEGQTMGWIAARSEYDGHVWELHPLVVRPDRQRQGIGTALVADLERVARERGATTLWLGSDDEADMASLSGVDLYPNPLCHLQRIQDRKGNPFRFFQRCGLVLVGVIPDANGPGKPDILMAKRLV